MATDTPSPAHSLFPQHLETLQYRVSYAPNGAVRQGKPFGFYRVYLNSTQGGQVALADTVTLPEMLAQWSDCLSNFEAFSKDHPRHLEDEGKHFVFTTEPRIGISSHPINSRWPSVEVSVSWLKVMRPVFQRILEEAQRNPEAECIFFADDDGTVLRARTAAECGSD